MAYPRVHWSVDGAAYSWNRGSNSIVSTYTAPQRSTVDGDSSGSQNIDNSDGFAINLAGVFYVDRIGVKLTTNAGAVTCNVEFSADSSNGIDGTWATLTAITLTTQAAYVEYPVAPTACAWLRCTPANGYHCYLYNFSIFGELQNPSYEFWDESEAVELNTTNYPLTFQPAGNSADSHQELRFKIKNTSASVHSYTVTVAKYKYDADAVVTSGITLSTDLGGSPAKTSSVTINDVAAGGFSVVIRVFADVTIAANPADGYHYFSIDVVQS